jgi:hypothetical protein
LAKIVQLEAVEPRLGSVTAEHYTINHYAILFSMRPRKCMVAFTDDMMP